MPEEHKLKQVYLVFTDGSVFKLDMETLLRVTINDKLGPPLEVGGSYPLRHVPQWRILKFTLEAERRVTFGDQLGKYIKGADR